MKPVTVKLLGTGGSEHTFDLPLSEAFLGQLRKGQLVPADTRSEKAIAKWLEDSEVPSGDDGVDVELSEDEGADRLDGDEDHPEADGDDAEDSEVPSGDDGA